MTTETCAECGKPGKRSNMLADDRVKTGDGKLRHGRCHRVKYMTKKKPRIKRRVKRKKKPTVGPDYVVAIPSHRRAEGFATKTLAYLQTTDVPLDRVHLFLSDNDDVRAYSQRIDEVVDNVITTHVCEDADNATDKFNAIHYAFPLGTRVFVVEDDISLMQGLKPGTNEKGPCTGLDAVIRRGFSEVGAEGLWGITPHSNAFFMSGKVSRNLKLIVAHAFGFVSTQRADLAVQCPSKTDYERTLRYFVAYGEVIRLDYVGPKTKSYTAQGGMQSDHSQDERKALEEESVAALTAEFPHLIARKVKKSSPFAEMRFKPCKLDRQALQEYQRALSRSRS